MASLFNFTKQEFALADKIYRTFRRKGEEAASEYAKTIATNEGDIDGALEICLDWLQDEDHPLEIAERQHREDMQSEPLDPHGPWGAP